LSQLPASFVTFLGDLRAEPVITASAAGRKADIILIHCRDDCPGAQALAGGIKIDDGFLVGSFFQQRKSWRSSSTFIVIPVTGKWIG